MQYSFDKTLDMPFDDAFIKVANELKKEGFSILTDIDVQSTLKKKLDVNFRRYMILIACNPPLAYKALRAESRIGTMLHVIVQETEQGDIEVSAIDPNNASVQAIENPELREIAVQIRSKLENVFDKL